MKTPLSEEILDSWELPEPPRHRLTVPDLLAAQAAAGRRVGLLLDLSNHDCLYASDVPGTVQVRAGGSTACIYMKGVLCGQLLWGCQ
jgi:hypothetical protein